VHAPKSKYENRNDEQTDDQKSVCVPVIVFSLLLVVDLRGTVLLPSGYAPHVGIDHSDELIKVAEHSRELQGLSVS
jgi:hypothetical protein